MADGRERQVSGHQRLAGRRQLPQKTDPDAGRLLGSCSKPLYQSGCSNPTANTASPANVSRSPPDARRTTLCPGVWPPVRETTTPGTTSYFSSNGRSWLWYSLKNRLAADRSASGNPGGMETREKSGAAQNLTSSAATWTRRS